jgi:hydrogenase expression/formation protein HypD
MNGMERIASFLRDYDGRPVSIMEVCGTHTAAIFKSGIRSLISPKIRLISGPGCPVCVTPGGFIDRLLEIAQTPGQCVLSFGDMLKVPGSTGSLLSRRGDGAAFRMVYSPLQALELAAEHPGTTFTMAAVGFETTAPAYALLLQQAEKRGLTNIRLLTALKAILPAMDFICDTEPQVDAFLCPGHVSTILGSQAYNAICKKYRKPMCVAGFDGEHLLAAIGEILTELGQGRAEVKNFYPEAVSAEGNVKAQALLQKYFESTDALWRGIGAIPASGLALKPQYARFDAGSKGLGGTTAEPAGCRCADVICGRIDPKTCPHFGRGCTPEQPIGACMVSDEGACAVWYRNVTP